MTPCIAFSSPQVAELIAACAANPELAENKVLEVVSETSAPALSYEDLLEAHPQGEGARGGMCGGSGFGWVWGEGGGGGGLVYVLLNPVLLFACCLLPAEVSQEEREEERAAAAQLQAEVSEARSVVSVPGDRRRGPARPVEHGCGRSRQPAPAVWAATLGLPTSSQVPHKLRVSNPLPWCAVLIACRLRRPRSGWCRSGSRSSLPPQL